MGHIEDWGQQESSHQLGDHYSGEGRGGLGILPFTVQAQALKMRHVIKMIISMEVDWIKMVHKVIRKSLRSGPDKKASPIAPLQLCEGWRWTDQSRGTGWTLLNKVWVNRLKSHPGWRLAATTQHWTKLWKKLWGG